FAGFRNAAVHDGGGFQRNRLIRRVGRFELFRQITHYKQKRQTAGNAWNADARELQLGIDSRKISSRFDGNCKAPAEQLNVDLFPAFPAQRKNSVGIREIAYLKPVEVL